MDNFHKIKTPLAVVMAMRWDILFDNLEDTFDQFAADSANYVADQSLARAGSAVVPGSVLTTLRHAATSSNPTTVRLVSGDEHTLMIRTVGQGWFSGYGTNPSQEALLIPLSALVWVSHQPSTEPPLSAVRPATWVEVLALWAKRDALAVIHTPHEHLAGLITEVDTTSLQLRMDKTNQMRSVSLAAVVAVAAMASERWL